MGPPSTGFITPKEGGVTKVITLRNTFDMTSLRVAPQHSSVGSSERPKKKHIQGCPSDMCASGAMQCIWGA